MMIVDNDNNDLMEEDKVMVERTGEPEMIEWRASFYAASCDGMFLM